MVQTIRIEAEARGQAGKGAARATRRQGLVPGVVYGAKREATLIALDPRVVMKELTKGGWRSHLYEVSVPGGTPERALMRDVQFHPVSDRPVHVDFQRLSPGQKIRVEVPVAFLNEEDAPGVKEGGVLNVVRRELEVMVDPDAVPEAFEIDLAEAQIGDGLRWSAVKDNFGAEPTIADRDFMIASIAAPTVLTEEEEAEGQPEAPPPAEAIKQKSGPATNVAAPKSGSPAKGEKAAAGDKNAKAAAAKPAPKKK